MTDELRGEILEILNGWIECNEVDSVDLLIRLIRRREILARIDIVDEFINNPVLTLHWKEEEIMQDKLTELRKELEGLI